MKNINSLVKPGGKFYISTKARGWNNVTVENSPFTLDVSPGSGQAFCPVFFDEAEAIKHCGDKGYLTMQVKKED